jgi:hypothetical protein
MLGNSWYVCETLSTFTHAKSGWTFRILGTHAGPLGPQGHEERRPRAAAVDQAPREG